MTDLQRQIHHVEELVVRQNRRLHEIDSRLDALEQAAVELSTAMSRMGEAVSPDKEKEQSEAHGS